MSDLRFESSLTMDEIEKSFKDVDFFSGIMEGAQEALAYTKGQAAADTFGRKRSLPTINIAEAGQERITLSAACHISGIISG